MEWYLVEIQSELRCFHLTHLPLNKMAAISQMIFSDTFSWMKRFVFWLKFHWSLFFRDQLTITQHWFRYWLDDKPLSEPMLTRFTYAYMQHKGEMHLYCCHLRFEAIVKRKHEFEFVSRILSDYQSVSFILLVSKTCGEYWVLINLLAHTIPLIKHTEPWDSCLKLKWGW